MFLRYSFALLFAALLSRQPSVAATVTDPSLTVENVIISGTISSATCMAFIGNNDILVGEKATGRVKRVTNGVVQGTIALDLPVDSASERGLLGMTLDPGFPTSNSVYLFYTRASADSTNGANALDHRVSKFTWNGSTLSGETVLLTLPITTGPNHDGGVILFGPPTVAASSRKLFGVIGDLNRNGQAQNYSAGAAPDDTGEIFRINSDGTDPSGAEAGPFFNVAGTNVSMKHMYAYGIRNSFGLDFDPVTGVLWESENGPSVYDEINRIDPGFNSGWERLMGPQSRNSFHGAPSLIQLSGVGTYSDPEFSWNMTPLSAPTAIHFLRSTSLGSGYQNDVFVGDANYGNLYHFEPNATRDGFVLTGTLADLVQDSGDSNTQILFGQSYGAPTQIQTGPDGNMYVLSLLNNQIYRIRALSSVNDWELFD
ncbi:MAG: PQQ-dependent sugar dehydrogenase [Candidatus Sumerlaeaceae bacterium]